MASVVRQGFRGRRVNLNRKQMTYLAPRSRERRALLSRNMRARFIASHVMSVFVGAVTVYELPIPRTISSHKD